MERGAIIVGTRNRFSGMTECLDSLIAHTPEPHDLIVVAGGASEQTQNDWLRRFGDRACFIFESHFFPPRPQRPW